MTTSIHLLVSDDSVAHTPLMYSEERGNTCCGKGTRPIWLQGLPWWIIPQWTSRLYQRKLSISLVLLIRKGTLLLTQKITTDHWKAHQIIYLFCWWDETSARVKQILVQVWSSLKNVQVFFFLALFIFFCKLELERWDWFVTKEEVKRNKDRFPFKKLNGRGKWRKKKSIFGLTEIPALP